MRYQADLPEDFEDSSVVGHYYSAEGGWGPVPALELTCKHCGKSYGNIAGGYNQPVKPPDPDNMKRWMREECPKGSQNCRI